MRTIARILMGIIMVAATLALGAPAQAHHQHCTDGNTENPQPPVVAKFSLGASYVWITPAPGVDVGAGANLQDGQILSQGFNICVWAPAQGENDTFLVRFQDPNPASLGHTFTIRHCHNRLGSNTCTDLVQQTGAEAGQPSAGLSGASLSNTCVWVHGNQVSPSCVGNTLDVNASSPRSPSAGTAGQLICVGNTCLPGLIVDSGLNLRIAVADVTVYDEPVCISVGTDCP